MLAGDHRRQQPGDGVQRTAGDIRHLHAQRQGPGVSAAGIARLPRQREVIDVMTGAIPVGARLPVPGDGHVDQLGVDCLQRLITQAQSLHHTGAKLLQDNVVVLHQSLDDLQCLGLLEVERKAALVAIEVGMARRHAPIVGWQHTQQIGAGRRLDAQHLGAHVGQKQRGKRPRQQCRKIQNLQRCQWTEHE
ncbi:hypothetical protein D3C73_1080030 [compost metagenome]